MDSDAGLVALAQKLQTALNDAVATNDALHRQIEEASKQAREADERAADAEQRVNETKQKLAILEQLKTKEYQVVITDLFEGPSHKAARLTVIVAILSITISLAMGVYQTTSSSSVLRQIQQTASNPIGHTATEVHRWLSASLASSPEVKVLSSYITSIREDCDDLRDINQLRLAYKLRVVWRYGPISYDAYLAAFKQAEIPEAIILGASKKLAQWDKEMLSICWKAERISNERSGIDSNIGAYKDPLDDTDYSAVRNPRDRMISAQLARKWADTFSKQLHQNSVQTQ